MLPPKVTVTIPAIRERRYVRREEGTSTPGAAPDPNLSPTTKVPGSATSRQRIYVGKPGLEPFPTPPPAPAAAPAPAPPPVPLPSVPVLVQVPVPAAEGEVFEVSAYTPDEARVLGTPRGLLPFAALSGLRPAGSPQTEEREELIVEEVEDEAPEPAHDPLLDEVIEGLRNRISELKTARRGPPSKPGEIAAPPTHPTAHLMRAPREKSSTVFVAMILVALVGGACAYSGQYFRQLFDQQAADRQTARPPETAATTPAPAPTAPPTPAQSNWQESDLTRLDAILSAERALSLEEMGRLISQLQADRPGLPGLEMLSARHSLLTRRFADAEVRLSRLLSEAGSRDAEWSAELAYLRARNYAAQRKLLEARNCLDESIRRDPRRAESHFEHGELNRRMGRMNEALADYDRALTRAQSGRTPSRAIMEFRRRLALVESDRESEMGSAVYMAELSKPVPPGEWVLTAAAVSLHRGDFAVAAQWMQRARSVMRPNDYLAAVEDYFFRNHASRPELKDAFPSASERSAFILRTLPFLADP